MIEDDVDLEKFKDMMEYLGYFLTDVAALRLFNACDLDKGGSIDLYVSDGSQTQPNRIESKRYDDDDRNAHRDHTDNSNQQRRISDLHPYERHDQA